MRSSKRSRGKSNRNRNNNPGNIINRVFDSSGPEGKVRGTPQQIIDKYTQLARDAALANDRVAAENFQQHSEHYTRLLGEAQREVEARRAAAEEQNRQRQQQQREEREAREAQKAERREAQRAESAGAEDQPQPALDPADAPQPDVAGDVIAPEAEADSGLVETPESKPKRRAPRPRKPRAPKGEAKAEAKGDAKADTKPRARESASADGPETPEAAE